MSQKTGAEIHFEKLNNGLNLKPPIIWFVTRRNEARKRRKCLEVNTAIFITNKQLSFQLYELLYNNSSVVVITKKKGNI